MSSVNSEEKERALIKSFRFLVTGGGGFIGSNIAEHLLSEGAFVRIYDNFLTGKRDNLSGFQEAYGERFHLVEGDVRDRSSLEEACEGIDFVLHEAALPSVPRSVEDPFLTNEINVGGTVNVLLAARDKKVKRVVFASSSSVYGDSLTLPKVETMTPAPKSPYALQKLTGEHYCRIFFQLYGLETVSLRYFNVFGPRQDPGSMYAAVVPNFISALISGKKPVVYGDGGQTRDFTYVDNVVGGNIRACVAPLDVCGKFFNVACGERYSLLDLIDVLGNLTGIDPDPLFEEERVGDVRDSMAAIKMAEELLSYQVEVSFEEGLEKTVEWHRKKVGL